MKMRLSKIVARKNVLTEYTDARQLGLMFQEEGFGSRWFADDVSRFHFVTSP